MTTAKQERGIIRRKLRQLAAHPRSKRILASLTRHRQILAHLRPPLRLRAWGQMQKLLDQRVTEQGGNNIGPAVERIIRANNGVPGEPWCGDTVAACYLWAGAKSVTRAWASVSWLERLLTRVHHPRRGHVVTYRWSHTGLFDRWAPEIGPGYFYAAEGNTGTDGNTSDQSGGRDGVHRRLRHVSQTVGIYRVLR